MIGEAHAVVSGELLHRIRTAPGIRDVVFILGEPTPYRYDSDRESSESWDKWLIRFMSPLLEENAPGNVSFVIVEDRLVRFVPDLDT